MTFCKPYHLRQTNLPARLTLALRIHVGILLCSLALIASTNLAAETSFRDPEDGWFDASEFLDTAYGFLPVIAPITEPAIGYGAAGALVFIDQPPSSDVQKEFTRPNMTVAGGLATENGTDGLFAAHLGTWQDDRLRTTAAYADMDLNLEYFGMGGQRNPGGRSVDYSVSMQGGVLGTNYRLGESQWWLGARYLNAKTHVSSTSLLTDVPGVNIDDLQLNLAAVTLSLTLDKRNNFFTPTNGWYVDLSVPIYRKELGSDRDFETAALQAMYYHPFSKKLHFALRGGAKYSTDDTPFYLKPYVWLRGVQALGYQGEQTEEIETELRWQMHRRFSLVGFAGTGRARSDLTTGEQKKSVTTGGGGFRYLVARKHGLHMGMDLAFGPDDPIIYVVFGSAWMRP